MKDNISNILCVLHDTHGQDSLVQRAMNIAQKYQAELTVMLAMESLPPNARMIMQSFEYLESQSSINQTAQDWLDEKAATWSQQYPVKTVVTIGDRFIDIIHHVTNNNHDLVIKQNENEASGYITSSDDKHLPRKCPCPVWIMQADELTKDKQVVAAIDVNYHYPEHEVSLRKQLAFDILFHAWQLAALENASLHIVHVYDGVPENILRQGFISVNEDAAQQDLNAIRQERQEEIDRLLGVLALEVKDSEGSELKPQVHLVRGYPRREIANTANACGATTLVMGTLSRLGVPGYIMGGTAEETLEQVECALYGLKPQGFTSPV
ncbi:universal stress protein [Alteromonas confluentis]|uniref:Universal stress protein UspA n=1 Tax=Alteromonas confluentis TaxID=1656094 RepID=A0A1E7Z6P6_9ALTE|nr:universal stress protein [Alteromonas confluentis]OFC69229.1 universal stress protein UspA [Alteromonas confluentis]